MKGHVLEHRDAGLVGERHVLERDVATHRTERRAQRVFGVFRRHPAQLVDPVEPRERFGDLRADRCDVDQRQRHEAHEENVLNELPQRHRSRQDRAAADENHDDRNRADHQLRKCADAGNARHRGRDVAEQFVGAACEDEPLAALGPVGLHDPDTAQRLGEPAGHVGVELAALAKQGA